MNYFGEMNPRISGERATEILAQVGIGVKWMGGE